MNTSTIKSNRHGFKSWLHAVERDCPEGSTVHFAHVLYSPKVGFMVKSSLQPVPANFIVALSDFEPNGTDRGEYKQAVRNLRNNELEQAHTVH